MQADGGRRGSGGGGSGVRDAAFAYDDVSDASSDENKTFEVARVLDHQVGPNGEPRYLVQWKGYGAEHDSWEPWTSLTMCPTVTAKWHDEHRTPPTWAAACPEQYDADADLPAWRVHSKRTSANKVLKVYYGPRGETVRSRTTALAICALYGKVKA